jgi:hypothetical protein
MGQVRTKPGGAGWPQLRRLGCFWKIVLHTYLECFFSKSRIRILHEFTKNPTDDTRRIFFDKNIVWFKMNVSKRTPLKITQQR